MSFWPPTQWFRGKPASVPAEIAARTKFADAAQTMAAELRTQATRAATLAADPARAASLSDPAAAARALAEAQSATAAAIHSLDRYSGGFSERFGREMLTEAVTHIGVATARISEAAHADPNLADTATTLHKLLDSASAGIGSKRAGVGVFVDSQRSSLAGAQARLGAALGTETAMAATSGSPASIAASVEATARAVYDLPSAAEVGPSGVELLSSAADAALRGRQLLLREGAAGASTAHSLLLDAADAAEHAERMVRMNSRADDVLARAGVTGDAMGPRVGAPVPGAALPEPTIQTAPAPSRAVAEAVS